MSTNLIFTTFLTIYITILSGVVIRLIIKSSQAWIKPLNQISVYFTFPILIFFSLTSNPIPREIWKNSLLPYLLLSTVIIISTFFLKKTLKKEEEKNAFLIGFNFSNIAFIGIPLISSLYANKLSVILYAATTLFLVFSIVMGAIQNGSIAQKVISPIKNPLFLASVVGIIFNVYSIELPSILTTTLKYPAFSATYIALFAIGLFLGGQNIRFLIFRKTILPSIFKLLIVPVLIYIILILLPFPPTTINSITLAFALPVAITPFSLSSTHPIDQNYIGAFIFQTTVLSMISLPIWVFVLSISS